MIGTKLKKKRFSKLRLFKDMTGFNTLLFLKKKKK